MSDLYTNLELINLEKTQKIIPENIKAGVTILGVTGTYTGEASTETTEENRECGQPQRWSAALSFPYIFLR